MAYKDYIRWESFHDNNRFSIPYTGIKDLTEKNHFSNIVGKAIADFLSKKIDNSLYTVNYEAAMSLCGHSLLGMRPDLLAFNHDEKFAIEAKGFSRSNISNNDMTQI